MFSAKGRWTGFFIFGTKCITMVHLWLAIVGILIFLFFIWFSWVSFSENEPRAGRRSLGLAFLLPLPFMGLVFIPFSFNIPLSVALLSLTFLVAVVVFFPMNGKLTGSSNPGNILIDERETMFSRKEITHRPNKFKQYYANHPEQLVVDQAWRNKPGLMSPMSKMYHPLTFAAAEASFYTIEQLREKVDGPVASSKAKVKLDDISCFIKNWSKKLGAVEVGFCETQPYHYYSHRGRGEYYGQAVENHHNYAIAFTVEMDKNHLATGPAGATLMESAQQYLDSGIIAIQVAKFIRDLGFEARAHIDGNYEVVCPLVARDAGLGEIGRMGLLMTPKLGPRVRIAVVTTNLPLQVEPINEDRTVDDFCSICKKCADVCPGQAIPKGNKINMQGVQRWQVNQEKCFSYWCTSGTDCGRCMSVCPYSHPNNLLHNLVRWGNKNSWVFRRVALKMDDFFYGRKPAPAKEPQWIPGNI